jgi:hypothetical protein
MHRGQPRQGDLDLVSDSDFDTAFARLRAARITYWADPMHQQPGQVNHWLGGRGVYFEDPDGRNMELLTRAQQRIWPAQRAVIRGHPMRPSCRATRQCFS